MSRLGDPFVTGSLVWLGALAISLPWLADSELRPTLDLRVTRSIVVTSDQDSGPGSLREAIFESARSDSRVRIVLAVPRIVLASALPALVSPHGVAIDASRSQTEIDARAVLGAPVFDLVGPNATIEGVRVRGAAGQAVSIRSSGAVIRGLHAVDCGHGVFMADETTGALIEDSSFEYNGIGVRVPEAPIGIVIRGSSFRANDQGGVWGVAARLLPGGANHNLLIRDNKFTQDRTGVLLLNVSAVVENNTFENEGEAAIYVGAPAEVRQNQVRGGGYGILAAQSDGAVFEANDISGSSTVGFLLREASHTIARNNRLDGNAYGFVTLFGERGGALLVDNLVMAQRYDGILVIGGSPMVRGNRVLGNQGAGLRIMDFISRDGRRSPAQPTFEDNTVTGNKADQPQRGTYREPARAPER